MPGRRRSGRGQRRISDGTTYVTLTRPAGRAFYLLRWLCPVEQRWKQRSTNTTILRDAETQRANLEEEIARGVPQPTLRKGWDDAVGEYQREKLVLFSDQYRAVFRTACGHLETFANPDQVRSVSSRTFATFIVWLRETKKVRASTARTYLKHLSPFFVWAKDQGYLKAIPKIDMPTRAKGASAYARSRAITTEELTLILDAVPAVRTKDADQWKLLIRALAHGGLRINELLRVSRQPGEPIFLDDSGKYPMLRMHHSADKGGADRLMPITPEFFAIAQEAKGDPLFVPLQKNGKPFSLNMVKRVISDVGKASGVITDATEKKHATSHDIGRRHLTSVLQDSLSELEVASFMRHADSETTRNFYDPVNAQRLAAKIWRNENGDTYKRTETFRAS